jgi:hypothetical protein
VSANLVYCDNFNLCENNYYFTLLTESTPTPPPILPDLHTGIANSGASGFYFAPGAPVSNNNSRAPTVSVRMANGSPECSVPNAALALASTLPLAAMLGHVLPSFPNSLIGLRPFANKGCKIIFDKTMVTVFHPNGHSILEGWHKHEGPQLW